MENIRNILPKVEQRDLNEVPNEEPVCPICKDGGFVHPINDKGKIDYSTSKRCICKKEADQRANLERRLKASSLPGEEKTMANFNTYGEKDLQDAKDLTQSLIDGDVIFLTLLSESDMGKSHLSQAACRAYIAQGKSARYAKVGMLLQELRDTYDKSSEDSYKDRLNYFLKVGLLVLDDLGTENMTQWGAEQIQMIIDYRYDNSYSLMVTSNNPIDDLFDTKSHKYDQWRDTANMRVESRLKREEWCRVLVIDTKKHMLR